MWSELRSLTEGPASLLPWPGSGRTPTRFTALADWGARDLSMARVLEGHADALAILGEADLEPEAGATYGVWAARPPGGGTTARLTTEGWLLAGTKPFCSGSTRLDRALITAECDDGYRLFDISVADQVTKVRPGSWPAVGMADSLSETLDFGGPPVPRERAVGVPGFYLERVLVRRRSGPRRGRAPEHGISSLRPQSGRTRTRRGACRSHAPDDRTGGSGDRCRPARLVAPSEAACPGGSARGPSRRRASPCPFGRGRGSAAVLP